jgi:hypothetical protein
VSRGPGRWQRAILTALDEYDVVPIADLCEGALGRPAGRPELVAARRAAHRLADTDQLREIYPWYCWRCGTILRSMTCLRCRRHPGCALAVTRDPLVMAEQLRGTAAWSEIPERLSVAFIREADSGNTYRSRPA